MSERSIHRWMAAGGYEPRSRQPWKLTPDGVQAFYQSGGRPAAAWRVLADAGADVRSQRVYYRALERELSPAERAYAREGEEGWRRHSVYLTWEPEARNEVWEADHAQLDVHVVPLRGFRLQSPWMTVIEDGYSRLIMGWALSLYPTSAEVLAALREAIIVDPDRGSWGGVPHVVRFDGGKDFLSNAVMRAAAEVGFMVSRRRRTRHTRRARSNGSIRQSAQNSSRRSRTIREARDVPTASSTPNERRSRSPSYRRRSVDTSTTTTAPVSTPLSAVRRRKRSGRHPARS